MREKALNIIRQLNRAGHEAFIVGGAVRDLLLGVEPNDFDIATNARTSAITSVFPKARPVAGRAGGAYGIVLVDGIEVAPYRRELEHDGRQAKVEFVSELETDLARRDFTVNAMALGADGGVIDYFGGERDLRNRVLSFVGSPTLRLAEDYLRGIRFARFMAGRDFNADVATVNIVRSYATKIASVVSGERILKEFEKANEFFSDFVCTLHDCGLLIPLFPELGKLVGSAQDPRWHPEGDVFVHTMLSVLATPKDATLETKLAILFHDIGKPDTKGLSDSGRIINHGHDKVGANITSKIMRRLGASNEMRKTVSWLVQNHMTIHAKDLTKKALRRRRREQSDFWIDELFKVALADSHGVLRLDKHNRDIKNLNLWEEVRNEPARRKPILGGRTVMSLLGIEPGPFLGQVLRTLMDWEDANPGATAEDARIFLTREFKNV